MNTLFISDLHLCKERPEIAELFLEFLEYRAKRSDALYILGDLFEVVPRLTEEIRKLRAG